MSGDTWMYVLRGLLVIGGLAGAILPALPGLIFGTLTKLALIFTMLGIFAFAWLI